MSKRSVQPDVAALLQSLREEVSQPGDRVRFDEADLIRRTSDVVTMFRGVQRPQPDLATVLEALREQVHCQEARVRFYDVGTVQQVGDGVATLSGLPRASTDELVTFPTGVRGLILNLDHARVDVILLGPDEGIRGGDLVTATGERLRVPVGEELLGRVVNPLGEALDGQGTVGATAFRYLEREAPGIVERVPVDEPLHTGLKIVDALVPIGRGQRELIVGDRQTGKTTLAVDAILNQDGGDVLCVYVATGQKKSSTLRVIETLRRYGALAYTIVVVSSPDDPPALRYLAPYTGCTMAESLMHEGRDVLIVYDDLSKHADAYRELSLLLRRPPGREAYPGDIFYLHARLLERACKLRPSAGGGSLTALPIVETQHGNIVAYIPTNLICATDMRVVLDADLFNLGVKPAVNVGRSVSRLSGAAQTAVMRELGRKLRLELAQSEEVARFARFGIEVDEATRRQIRRGERFRAVFRQPAHRPLSLASQVIVLLAATEGYLDAIALEDVPAFESELLLYFESRYTDLCRRVDRTGELDDKTRQVLVDMLVDIIAEYREAWAEQEGRPWAAPRGE